MKKTNIRLTAGKMDAAADIMFDVANGLEKGTSHAVQTPENMTLAGLALRKWAVEMRQNRKARRLRRWRPMRAGELTAPGDQYQTGKTWHDFAAMNRHLKPGVVARTRRPLPAAFHRPAP